MSPSPLSVLLHHQRILVVDDAEDERALLIDFLREQGCRVYIAHDGEDGYAKAQVLKPDLILMDIHMPVLDGMGACRLLKANPNTRVIPLIFLTAAVMPHERVAGLSAGAVDYVTKPFDFEEVRLRLCIHLKAAKLAARENVEPGRADTEPTIAAPKLDGVVFEAARRMLIERLGHTPDLGTLAKAVGTNPRRLNSAFRQCVGVTVFDFLREEKLKEARRLLADTDLEIQTIASELGYSSAANFSTAFRGRFGLPPSAFRQEREHANKD
jgi:CheY-like chemotaxis protein